MSFLVTGQSPLDSVPLAPICISVMAYGVDCYSIRSHFSVQNSH